ncbi:MAG: hypothetical protein EOL97_12870 [Spirochaetia bacterium]|nr:hypothetical protein [Spirochaetia bacterium]
MVTLNIDSDCKVLNRVDYTQIEDELILFLRNNLTDRRGRALNKTETFVPDGSTTLFELTGDLDNKNNHKVMNIRTLNIDGIEKTFYTDYDCGFKLRNNNLTTSNPNIGKIQFWNAPTGSLISLNYDHAYSFVWPQNNRVDLSTIDYPRVTLDTSGEVFDMGIGGSSTTHNITVTITVTDILIEGVRAIIQEIKNLFVQRGIKKRFHNFTYIQVSSIGPGPLLNTSDTNDVIYEQTIVLLIPLQFEMSSC